jgi:hypothetical protein
MPHGALVVWLTRKNHSLNTSIVCAAEHGRRAFHETDDGPAHEFGVDDTEEV